MYFLCYEAVYGLPSDKRPPLLRTALLRTERATLTALRSSLSKAFVVTQLFIAPSYKAAVGVLCQ